MYRREQRWFVENGLSQKVLLCCGKTSRPQVGQVEQNTDGSFLFILLPSSVCGKRPLVPKNGGSMQTVGGADALPGAWPWVVSLQLPAPTGHKHSCEGSLVTAQWVLTAAHCFGNKRNLPHWRAVIGASNLSALGSEVHVRFAKQVVLHEQYQPGLAANDIALLELDQPVKCSKYIQPACVPDGSVRLVDLSNCYISGWSITKEHCED
uniref:Uncharacterized protein n=1 Tax=Sphaerodactylus townsendi TaxID=933632 RepID=A0ACB8FM13_9SAUR